MKEEVRELYKKHDGNLMFHLVLENQFFCRLLYIETEDNLISEDMLDYLYETVTNDQEDFRYLEEKVSTIKELDFPDSKQIIDFVEELNPKDKIKTLRMLRYLRRNRMLDLDDVDDICFILYVKGNFKYKEELIESLEKPILARALIKHLLSDELLMKKTEKIKYEGLFGALELQRKENYSVSDYDKVFGLIETKKYMIEESFKDESVSSLGQVFKYLYLDNEGLTEKILTLLKILESHKKLSSTEVERILPHLNDPEDISYKIDFFIYALKNIKVNNDEELSDFIQMVFVYHRQHIKSLYEIHMIFPKNVKLNITALNAIVYKINVVGYKATLETLKNVLEELQKQSKNPIKRVFIDDETISSKVYESITYLKLVNTN